MNVAARLEQSAEPGAVLVGERTQLMARRLVRFGQPTALEVKGKTGPLVAYRVEGFVRAARRAWRRCGRLWSGAIAS